MEKPRPARWPILIGAIVLVYLTCAVFWPMPGFEFVDLDVEKQIVRNPSIQGLTGQNLRSIFTSPSIYSYYPVRTLSFAVDYHFWGLNPKGYKLTNGLIHLANVLLVFWLMLRLAAWAAGDGPSTKAWWTASVAAFSAAVFAIHPAVVQPVVWVAGREELLMTLGALACLHCHLTARRRGEQRRDRAAVAWHAAATLCCLAACLSNVVAAVIPALVLAWDALTPARPKLGKILLDSSPLWVVSGTTILLKKVVTDAPASPVVAFSGLWVMQILNVYWLNLKTLFWPVQLAQVYDWVLPASVWDTQVILGGIALGLTCLAFWRLRRRRWILFGLVWFALALAPTSQIVPHHVHRADRFLYLPLVGLVIAMAMGLRPLATALKGRATVYGTIAAAVLGLHVVFVLHLLSAAQVQTWRNSVTMWANCVRVDPANPLAHGGLADNLAMRGQFKEAIPYYERALELDPLQKETLHNFATHLTSYPDRSLRNYDLAIRLAERACELSQWEDPEIRHTLAMTYNNTAMELQRPPRPQFDRAIQCYRRALEVEPDYYRALLNLAMVLARCPDPSLRDVDEALRLVERARRLVDHPEAIDLRIVAAVYAEAGWFESAAGATEKAIGLARAAGDADLASQLQRELRRYQARSPSRLTPD